MRANIIPTKAAAGAEIRGLNLSVPIDKTLKATLDQALGKYGVIFFRNQSLSPEQHLALTKSFGDLEFNTFGEKHGLNGYPGIVAISNIEEKGREIGVKGAGDKWHSDMCYTIKPPRGTILYAHEVPKLSGLSLGDTCFAACHAAYKALPKTMKLHIKNMRAIFNFAQRKRLSPITQKQIEQFPPAIHPVVRTHPITKQKCLYIMKDDCTGIEGLEHEEALQLIAALADHIIKPEFIYRHQWRKGDVLIWDNCTVQHKAVQDYSKPNRRLMHRTTFAAKTIPT